MEENKREALLKREILLKQLAEKSNKQNLANKQIIMGATIWFCSTVVYWIYAFISWVVRLNLKHGYAWAKNFDWFLEKAVREQLWFWLILYVIGFNYGFNYCCKRFSKISQFP